MIITLHILIALVSMAITTVAFVRPTRRLLYINYGFIGLTIASGVYLTVLSPAHMIETCTVGLTYLAVVSVGTVLARVKLGKLAREVVTTK